MRLFGIDAPERGQVCADASDKRFLCGSRAADELAAILGRNPRVSCRQTGWDRWRRVIAICRLGELDIGAEMVRRGRALDFIRYSRGRYEAREEAARDAKAGCGREISRRRGSAGAQALAGERSSLRSVAHH